jgi:hypothetical protein
MLAPLVPQAPRPSAQTQHKRVHLYPSVPAFIYSRRRPSECAHNTQLDAHSVEPNHNDSPSLVWYLAELPLCCCRPWPYQPNLKKCTAFCEVFGERGGRPKVSYLASHPRHCLSKSTSSSNLMLEPCPKVML